MEECTNNNLLERARQGQVAAIAELYNCYWRAARAAAYGVTADFYIAEDAACEAFYTAIDSLNDLKDTQCFGPWLRTIVIRTAMRLKAAHSKVKSLEQLPKASRQISSDLLEQQEITVLIHEAIGALSPNHREAISLFYFEGYNIKDAAAFLNIPQGTFKRRLHEGRNAIKDSVEKIIEGVIPMNPKREQILKQLKEASKAGIQSEAFYQPVRKALRLRPVPNDLLKEIMLKHLATRKKKLSVQMLIEKEHQIRENIIRLYAPSKNVEDPNHPIGAVANAIQAELSEFKSWQVDWTKIDIIQMGKNYFKGIEKFSQFLYPPDFIDDSEGSYMSTLRAWMVRDEDGSLCTMYELMEKKATIEDVKTQLKHGKCLSDTMLLLWKKQQFHDLHSVEELLLRLSHTIIPDAQIKICSYNDPRYRLALRMQLGKSPIPAAIGGVLSSFQGLPPTIKVASVTIFLEPWATARTGQYFELTSFSASELHEDKNQ